LPKRRILPLKNDTAYKIFDLLLPKKLVNVQVVKNSLTFFPSTGTVRSIAIWKETDTHLIVPRNFYTQEQLLKAGIPFVDISVYKEFEKVNVHSSIEPRDDIQREALKAIRGKEGTLVLACGRGKTAISLKEALIAPTHPIIVVVNKTQLMSQWSNEIEKLTLWDKRDIGLVSGTKSINDKNFLKPIVIAMIHTLASSRGKVSMRYRLRFGTAIYDEAHHVAAEVFSRAANLFIGRRLGITATHERSDGMEKIYQYHLGEPLYINLEQPLKINIRFLRTKTEVKNLDDYVNLDTGRIISSKIVKFVLEDEDRNSFILQEVMKAIKAGRTIMICTPTKAHAEYLHEQLTNLGVDAKLIYGVVGKGRRAKRQQDITEGKVLVATHELGYEALDKEELDTIFVTIPYSKPIFWRQLLGRAQREYEGKKDPLCIVFEDPLIAPTYSTAKKAKKVLAEMGYDFISIKV